MSTMPIDLEGLASGYSHRPTSEAARNRAARAARSAGLGPGDIAIDVGGGRGAHAQVWAESGAQAIVVDPSDGMSRAAAGLHGVAAIRAYSQRLPLREKTASLVYFHLSIHYGDWAAALDEARRITRASGECWIWTMGERHHRSSFLARWFPSVGDIDSARFPVPGDLVAHLEKSWSVVESGQEVEPKTRSAGDWKAATEAGFISTLQLISKDEFTAGLRRFDEAYPDPEQPVDYLLTFDWIRARK